MKQKKLLPPLGQPALSYTTIPWRLYNRSTPCAGASIVKDLVRKYLVADYCGSSFSGINNPQPERFVQICSITWRL